MRFFMPWCLLLLAYSYSFAQNTSLLYPKDAEFPVDLNSLCNEELKAAGDLNKVIQYAYKLFRTTASNAYEGKIIFFLSSYDFDWKYVTVLRQNIIKDTKLIKEVYKSVFPVFLAQFKIMTPNEQQTYVDNIQDGLNYATNFDLEKEKAELEKDIWGFRDKKGALNSFIFRRISKGELSQKDCIYWLKKCKKDLASQQSKSKKPEDQYILKKISSQYDDFVVGTILGSTEVTIFEKKGDRYEMLALEKGLSNGFYSRIIDNGIWYYFKEKNGESKIGIFRKDKAPIMLDMGKDIEGYPMFSWFDGSEAWILGSTKKGMTTLYAINEAGVIEKNELSLNDNRRNSDIFIFQFESGKKKLLQKKADQILSDIKDPEKVFGYRSSSYLILDAKNQLYYYNRYRKKLIGPFVLTSKVKDLRIIKENKFIIQYENGSTDLCSFGYDNKLSKITLTQVQNIIKFDYRWMTKDNKKAYLIQTEDKSVGAIDEDGKIILDAIYKTITKKANKIYIEKDGKVGLCDDSGNIQIKPSYATLEGIYYPSLDNKKCFFFRLEKDGPMGVVNESGDIILKPTYKHLKVFKRDILLFIFTTENNLQGLIDAKGNIVVEPIYTKLQPFYFGNELNYLYFTTENKGLKGVIDVKGTVAAITLKPIYKNLQPFHIDKNGKLYFYFEEKEGNLKGVIDIKGNSILEPIYSSLRIQAKISKNEKLYFDCKTKELDAIIVSNNDKVIIPGNCKKTRQILDSPLLFLTERNKKGSADIEYLVIDGDGKILLKSEYSLNPLLVNGQKEPLFLFQEGADTKKVGCISLSGKIIHPATLDHASQLARFDDHGNFLNGTNLCIAGKKDAKEEIKYALFSKDFIKMTDYIFEAHEVLDTIITFDPETFEEMVKIISGNFCYFWSNSRTEVVVLSKDGKKTLYDFKGNMIIAPIWEEISPYSEGNCFMVSDGKNWGLVNRLNKVVAPIIYQKIEPATNMLSEHFILKLEKEAYYLVDRTGKKVFAEPQADIITYEDVPLLFVGKKMTDSSIKYALYSLEGKALTAFEFSHAVDTIITFDPETFQEIVQVVRGDLIVGEDKAYDPKKKTITLFRDHKKVLYNFEGKEVK